MLITPSLLHVKTGSGKGQQEAAALLRAQATAAAFKLDGLTAEDVVARLDVPVMLQGPESIEWQCIRDDHAAIAGRGDWLDALEALRFADQERTMASGGRRVALLISEGIRAELIRVVQARDLAGAETELRRFEAVFEMFPENIAAAHLLAQAQIDLGTLARDLGGEGPSQRELWAKATRWFADAEALLDEFDPIEQMSPLLAATRYQLVRGVEDGARLCRDWFEDWCDLDPEDAMAHATHALFMLPGWFGSLIGFEREARRAATITHGATGKAAYAVFHLTAAEVLGDLMPTLDIGLFVEALADYQAATGCQHRANVAANVLVALVQTYHQAGPQAQWHLSKARSALSDVLWNRLHEVHLDRWTLGADGLAMALGEVFGPALTRGARICRRGEGLMTRIPRA